MTDTPDAPDPSNPWRIDRICDRFEDEWRSGRRPRIEDFCAGLDGSRRRSLLWELLLVELDLVKAAGDSADQSEYERRFPDALELVRDAFLEANRSDAPTPDFEIPDAILPGDVAVEAAIPSPDAVSKVLLEVVAGPHRGARFEFERREIFLAGRAREANLCLADDPRVSRFHFRMEIDPPACLLVDLGSRNGTFVNRKRIEESSPLAEGDVISAGNTQLRFSMTGSCAPIVFDEASTINFPESSDEPANPTAAPVPAPIEWGVSLPVVPGYDLREELGRGGMGVVYRALHKKTRHERALKIIIPERMTCGQSLQVFLREASILSQLHHPSIVKFYELGVVQHQLFLAMEYVDAIPAKPIFESERESDGFHTACTIICQVLDALQYAHELDVVHRDVKPANILLSRSDDRLLAKLADFGLAKNYANAGFSGISHEGDLRGSLSYMAPEQIANCRFATPACDIYSTGATLYRYLSGSLPFDFSGDRGALAAVVNCDPIPLSERRPDLSPELVAIVARAMAKSAEDRFGSAAEMRQALLPFAHGDVQR